MNLKQMVEQINRQLTISDSYEERRLLKIKESEDQLIYSEDDFDFFLIPIDGDVMEEQERLEGLFVSVSGNVLTTNLFQNFVIIRTQSSRRDVFVPFISELICKDLSSPIEALNETLQEWREFWSGKRARLSKQEQVGLLGELIVLTKLLQHSDPKIVKTWGGPLEWLHDFQSESLDLEVKTTTKQPDSVYISKISQVAPMEGSKQLNLIVVGLEEGDKINLPNTIEIIRSQISDSLEVNHFNKVLRSAGYREEDEHNYQKSYSITFTKYHQITDESPVLKPSILGDLPKTVENIKYNLLTHAIDTIEINDIIWKEFADLM